MPTAALQDRNHWPHATEGEPPSETRAHDPGPEWGWPLGGSREEPGQSGGVVSEGGLRRAPGSEEARERWPSGEERNQGRVSQHLRPQEAARGAEAESELQPGVGSRLQGGEDVGFLRDTAAVPQRLKGARRLQSALTPHSEICRAARCPPMQHSQEALRSVQVLHEGCPLDLLTATPRLG